MADVLPQMRQFLKEGPITKSVNNQYKLPRNPEQSTLTPSQIIAKTFEPFYRKWMLSLDIIAAVQHSPTHTQMTFQFRVLPEYLNPSGSLHGAGQSLFFDACTTMLLGPIARPPDFWTTYGTSRSLNVMYFRPAYEGDLLTLEVEV